MQYQSNTNKTMLGQWIHRLRGKESLKDVEYKSGVSAPTISRIENGAISDPTLETVVRICQGLSGNPDEYIREFRNVDSFETPQHTDSDLLFPNKNDVEVFENFFNEKPEKATEVLLSLVNRILITLNANPTFDRVDDEKGSLEGLLKITLVYAPEIAGIFRLPSLFFKWGLNYPPIRGEKMPMSVNAQKDAVILTDDVTTYCGFQLQKMYFKSFNGEEKFFPTERKLKLVSKLRHMELLGGVRLCDIIELNEAFDSRGELIEMSWRAVETEIMYSNYTNFRFGQQLVYLSRWAALFGLPLKNWITELRHTMGIK